jgi:hypothetical protein
MDFFNATTDKACTLFLVRSSPRTQHPCCLQHIAYHMRQSSEVHQRTLDGSSENAFTFLFHLSLLQSCSQDRREVWLCFVVMLPGLPGGVASVRARACACVLRVWHQCVRVHAASVRARACACVRARHQCVRVHARACVRVRVPHGERPFSPSPEHSADVSESLPLGAASPPSPLRTYPDRCAAFLSSLPPNPLSPLLSLLSIMDASQPP